MTSVGSASDQAATLREMLGIAIFLIPLIVLCFFTIRKRFERWQKMKTLSSLGIETFAIITKAKVDTFNSGFILDYEFTTDFRKQKGHVSLPATLRDVNEMKRKYKQNDKVALLYLAEDSSVNTIKELLSENLQLAALMGKNDSKLSYWPVWLSCGVLILVEIGLFFTSVH